MTPYNRQYDPPAPFLDVTIANRLIRRNRLTMPALLDTGSDFTAIPSELVDQLKLYATSRILIEDVQQQVISVFVYTVRLTLVDIIFPETKVITTELEHAIIGRDLLNQFHLELDGRAQRFAVRSYE